MFICPERNCQVCAFWIEAEYNPWVLSSFLTQLTPTVFKQKYMWPSWLLGIQTVITSLLCVCVFLFIWPNSKDEQKIQITVDTHIPWLDKVSTHRCWQVEVLIECRPWTGCKPKRKSLLITEDEKGSVSQWVSQWLIVSDFPYLSAIVGNFLLYQPTNLPTYQPTNLPIYQPTNLLTYQPTNMRIPTQY